MKAILSILAMLTVVSIAGAVVDLSGTDPAVFDQPSMQKDGVGTTQLGAEIWGTPLGWNNVADGKPYGDIKPALVGSLAKEAYLNDKPADLPTTAAQFEDYLNKTLNRTDVVVIDALNATEGV